MGFRLSAALLQRIQDLSANHSNRQIAAILTDEGTPVSYATVSRVLQEERKERSAVSRKIVTEHIQRTVPTDLLILEQTRDQLNRWRLNCDDDGEPMDPPLRISERLLVIDRLNSTIGQRLKHSGADPADSIADSLADIALEVAGLRDKR